MSKKKTASRNSSVKPKGCSTENCNQPRAPGCKYCQLCEMTIRANKHVNQAHQRGDFVGALVNTGLVFLWDGIRTGKLATAAEPIIQRQFVRRPAPQSPQPKKADPWSVLGLNAKIATENDVRRIQRAAAKMWHEDRGGGVEAQARLGEINAAAEECLKQIRARG